MLQQNMNSAEIMPLEKMGSRYPSRLSFSRSMLRRLLFDNWKISKSKFDLDENGYGTAIYEIKIKNNIYSLGCFSEFSVGKLLIFSERARKILTNFEAEAFKIPTILALASSKVGKLATFITPA